jgi:Flp pilus assembly protein TadG
MHCFARKHRSRRGLKSRKGAMLVLVAVSLMVLLVAAAFSVDIAYMHLAR